MANLIEVTDINPNRFVPFTSRYTEEKVIYYTERKLLTFRTYKKKPVVASNKDKFAVISKGYEYRPDLLSQDAYGTPDFWWKIMERNNLKDIFEFKAGLNIVLPDALLI